jgi:two-component system phosphate regulon sensor histidine kinase PhoR
VATRPSFRVISYALAIAVPTLVLLGLGLLSVRRQQQAIVQLELANLRLTADQAARNLAARLAGAAAACLRDEAWRAIAAEPTPVKVNAFARRHPVAGQLVMVADREVVYPRLASTMDVPAADVTRGGACGDAIEAAEAREFGGDAAAALQTYRQCLARQVPGSTSHARLLARVARAERRRGNDAAAAETYAALASTHADASDRFGRPFGLVAALELHALSGQSGDAVLRKAREDLARGRWNISDEQATYFLDEMSARLGGALPAGTPAPFLETLQVARAVQASLPLRASLATDGVIEDEIVLRGRRTRVYHAPTGAAVAGVRTVLVPDPQWVSSTVLPDVVRASGLPEATHLVVSDPMPPAPGIVASADGALTPWRVWVPLPGPAGATRRLPVALQGAITLLVSGVLGMGVFLLVRDVRREQSVATMRSQFVSAASHELRTPLAMILLYAQTLLEDVDADREERRGSYEIIAEESERLRHLLDKVLDFSRIDAGRRSYRFVVADLAGSVRAAVRLFEPHLLRRGFTLDAEIAAIPDVRHDPEAITGAVLNLLENAAKYSASSREIALRLSVEGERAVIVVRDDGIGIPAEDLPHIGEQFFRSRLSTAIGGYGLGLYLVQHAMRAHGGRMDVASAPGAGSTFSLVLPRRGAPIVTSDVTVGITPESAS